MNVRRFLAKTSREALAQVRAAFGDEAIVLSTKPGVDGVEMLAMAAEGAQQIEQLSQSAARPAAGRASAPATRPKAAAAQDVQRDVEQLSMSTLSFQDYVRERMLKRRQAALAARQRGLEPAESQLDSRLDSRFDDAAAFIARQQPPTEPPSAAPAATVSRPSAAPNLGRMPSLAEEPSDHRDPLRMPPDRGGPQAEARLAGWNAPAPTMAGMPAASAQGFERQQQDQQEMMAELRSMKGLIEERFGALAFLEKMQRQPAQARLAQKLLDAGFSPALIRKLADGMGQEVGDEMTWVANVLERNLLTGEHEPALEDQGGVFALIGSTGVGKTTTTAKLAAAFATKHGAGHLGLITLDAYRVAAHEQLRAYGRILGVPVHTAHDRASLEDLLDLLSAKKMVLIDTAGIGQRDARTRELLEMLGHRSINKLLVVNSASQGETIEDVMLAYRANQCAGLILSKLDEALKLGPALDALIRHRLKVVGVANGQRVPEDWHRLSAQALVHRALRSSTGAAYRMDPQDVNLVFTAARPSASHGLHP